MWRLEAIRDWRIECQAVFPHPRSLVPYFYVHSRCTLCCCCCFCFSVCVIFSFVHCLVECFPQPFLDSQNSPVFMRQMTTERHVSFFLLIGPAVALKIANPMSPTPMHCTSIFPAGDVPFGSDLDEWSTYAPWIRVEIKNARGGDRNQMCKLR